jgi:hypothetical protein
MGLTVSIKRDLNLPACSTNRLGPIMIYEGTVGGHSPVEHQVLARASAPKLEHAGHHFIVSDKWFRSHEPYA